MEATLGTGADKRQIPLLELWHKGTPPTPAPWPRCPSGRISHRLRKKIKGNPDLFPKSQNLDLGEVALQSSKEVVLGRIKGAQSRERPCSLLSTPVGLG